MFHLNGASMMHTARSLIAAVLAPILVLALAGCSDAPETAPDSGPPNPLLYEIANADGAVEGWMIGTIHALPDGTQWRTPAIAAAVNEADVLVAEIAALDDQAGLAATFAALGHTPEMPPLEQRVTDDLKPALSTLLDNGGLDPNQFNATETWAAALTLAQIDADGDPANGVDRALIREFAGRPVHELEGAKAQLSIFDRLPESDQRDLLAAVVSGSEGSKTQADKLRRAWRMGDTAALEQASRTGILADPDLREALLVQRNRDWVAAIIPRLKAEPKPLIAVGAAHLVGPEGLASLLQAQGYRVQRLP